MIIYNGEMDKELHRNVFARVLEELFAEDKDVVYLDADLTNAISTRDLWLKHRDHVINVGIAEANMTGIAAGLSAGGKKPYIHTFGTFATRRVFDQMFLSVGYAGNSVRVIGSDPGVTASFNGGTHMPFEDVALMRTIPDCTILEVSDASMFAWALRAVKDLQGVSYIRTTRKNYSAVYSSDHPFAIGKSEVLREGSDVTIIAAGLLVGEAIKAAAELDGKGIKARVVDMFTIKPVDTKMIIDCAKTTGKIITAENHNVIGGLGDAVGSALLESGTPARMVKVGVNDIYGSVGPQEYLQEFYGLTAKVIVKTALELVGK